jgi:hypothetical protein
MGKIFLRGKENDLERKEEFVNLSRVEKLGWQGMEFKGIQDSGDFRTITHISNIQKNWKNDAEWYFEGKSQKYSSDEKSMQVSCYFNCELGIGWMKFVGESYEYPLLGEEINLARIEKLTKVFHTGRRVYTQGIQFVKPSVNRLFIASISKVERKENNDEWYFEGRLQWTSHLKGSKVRCYYNCKTGLGWIE